MADTTQYILQTTYISCTGGGNITGTDTITIIKRQPNPIVTNNNGVLQTDRDGSFSYSNTIRVLPCKKTFVINNIYPNPANSNITIEYNSKNAGRITVTIFDMVGRVVSQHALQCNAGYNMAQVPVAYLSKGKYILKLANGEGTVQSTFLKY